MSEQTKYWAGDPRGEVTLLHARYVHQRFDPHTHDVFSIGVVLEGVLGFEHERRAHAAPAGTISLMNPGHVHTGYGAAGQGWEYRNFFVDPGVLARLAAETTGRETTGREAVPFFPSPVLDDADLAAALLRVHRMLEAEPDDLARESALLAALAMLVQRHAAPAPVPPPPGREPAAVQRAQAYLRAHLGANPSLAEVARVAGLSPYHFLRVFRSATGLTPHAFLTQVRVEAACRMIAAGTPLAETALACGFADQSHLTRRFKRITGVTPGRYTHRKTVRDGF